MDRQVAKKVLILDDDQTVANSLAMILLSELYEVEVVYAAESALDLLASWKPDIAIVDILLPGMNGVEFAIQLEKACPGCHVLLFTALIGWIEHVEAARANGHAYDVLQKPVPPPLMLHTVASLLSSAVR